MDFPAGTNYDSRNSSYQRLIQSNVYQSVDILNICFLTTLPTSTKTVPQGDVLRIRCQPETRLPRILEG